MSEHIDIDRGGRASSQRILKGLQDGVQIVSWISFFLPFFFFRRNQTVRSRAAAETVTHNISAFFILSILSKLQQPFACEILCNNASGIAVDSYTIYRKLYSW
jgi:cytochrome bd-type quinol oxidase subunit 1